MKEIIVNSEHTREALHAIVDKMYDENHYLRITIATGKQRSKKQQAALEIWCRQVSEALNDAGLDQRKFLKPSIAIPWDDRGRSFKDLVWRPVQRAITGRDSTTEPERSEYPKIYEIINMHMASEHGISVPWPEKEKEDDSTSKKSARADR